MKMLDIGCGAGKTPGALGIDRRPLPGVDIVHDLDRRPWPLDGDAFDVVVCHDILEHLEDVVGAVEEIHRVSRAGARVHIRVPSASGVLRHADPTHRRGFTSRSFHYFVPGTPESRFFYSHARFDLLEVEYLREGGNRAAAWLDGPLLALANRFKDFYEARLLYIYPIPALRFELRVRK